MFFKFKINRAHSSALMDASVIGMHMVSGTFVGLGIGYFLDKWLGSKPWLTLVFLILGVVAGFRMVFMDSRKVQMQMDQAQKEQDAERAAAAEAGNAARGPADKAEENGKR